MIAAMIALNPLTITPTMLSLVAELDEFKGAWRAIGRIAPDRLRQLRKVATIESVGSSTRIEGAKLSDREVEALLGRLQSRSFTTRDEQEVAGYAEVMETVFEHHAAIPITENYVRQLHATLLRHSEKDARHRGRYKTLPNQVEAFDESGRSVGVIFETTSPFDTPREMEKLFTWFTQVGETKSLHPALAVGVFVVAFLAIHPFQDGNGRLSRVLTTLLLLKAGYAHVPYSSLESVIEQNKEAYYLALRRTQATLRDAQPATTDWTPWLTFFLEALQKQKRRLEEKVERERIMRGSMPELSIRILDIAGDHGDVSVSSAMRVTEAPRGTIKKRLADLVAEGHLRRVGEGRGARYVRA